MRSGHRFELRHHGPECRAPPNHPFASSRPQALDCRAHGTFENLPVRAPFWPAMPPVHPPCTADRVQDPSGLVQAIRQRPVPPDRRPPLEIVRRDPNRRERSVPRRTSAPTGRSATRQTAPQKRATDWARQPRAERPWPRIVTARRAATAAGAPIPSRSRFVSPDTRTASRLCRRVTAGRVATRSSSIKMCSKVKVDGHHADPRRGEMQHRLE